MAEYMTPFAYLLHLLEIKYTQMARVLEIDRSVVNKWALGIRPFHTKSRHFQNVIYYLLIVNENNGKGQLEKLVESRYPLLSRGENWLETGLRLFLSGTVFTEQQKTAVKGKAGSRLRQKEAETQSILVPTATNLYGRFLMLSQLLDEALNAEEPVPLVLYDNEQFSWIVENPHYFNSFRDQLLELIKREYPVTLISDLYYLERYAKFAKLMPILYGGSSFREYSYVSQRDLPLAISYYAITGRKIIYGKRIYKNLVYTIQFHDPLSLQSFGKLMESHLARCNLHFVARSDQEKKELFYYLYNRLDEEGIGFLYSPGLSFFTMSEQLLLKVLEENEVDRVKQLKVLLFHRRIKKQLKGGKIKQICHYQQVFEMTTRLEVSLAELTQFIGKKIFMTKEHVIGHIYDTIALLEDQTHYSLGLLLSPVKKEEETFYFLCKENRFLLTCQEVFKCMEETILVQGAIEMIQKEWNVIPADYKNRDRLVKKLRQLAESAHQ